MLINIIPLAVLAALICIVLASCIRQLFTKKQNLRYCYIIRDDINHTAVIIHTLHPHRRFQQLFDCYVEEFYEVGRAIQIPRYSGRNGRSWPQPKIRHTVLSLRENCRKLRSTLEGREWETIRRHNLVPRRPYEELCPPKHDILLTCPPNIRRIFR